MLRTGLTLGLSGRSRVAATPRGTTLATTVLAYAVTVVASCGLAAWGYRLDVRDLHRPLFGDRPDAPNLDRPPSYQGDALLMYQFVKATVDEGWYWHYPRLGAPGTLWIYDFTQTETLSHALVKLIALFGRDPVRVANWFLLLTYPLAAVAAHAAARAVGLSTRTSILVGLLYAVLPYHTWRHTYHLMLSAYFTVPPVCAAATVLARGEPVRFRSVGAWLAALGAALVGCGATYYGFYAAYVFVAAGVIGWLRGGRSAFTGGMLLATVVVAAGAASAAPALLYRFQHGPNDAAHVRQPIEADLLPLKPAHLVLPIPDHRLSVGRRVAARYDDPDRPQQFESASIALGAVGAVGVVLLTIAFARRDADPVTRSAAFVSLAIVILACQGGLGSLFNAFAYPQIRSYNRVVVFLGWFALVAVARSLSARPCSHSGPALLAVCAFGVWDQTPREFGGRPRTAEGRVAKSFDDDRAFGSAIEAALPPRASVFQLPYHSYPECPPAHGFEPYTPLAGWLHTNDLRWSFGAMRGRAVDSWQRRVSFLPPDDLGAELVAHGFDAIVLDKRGYADEGQSRIRELSKTFGPPAEVVSGDPRVMFSLAGYSERVRREYGVPALAALRERPDVLFASGIATQDKPGTARPLYLATSKARLTLVNPGERTRDMTFRFHVRTPDGRETNVRITGPGFDDRTTVGPAAFRTYRVTLPPGEHAVMIRTDAPTADRARFSRDVTLELFDVELVESK
jgi:phosphoglycerol transferase